MTRTILPRDPVHRSLTIATMAASLSTGLFYSVSVLYFTRVIGLAATTVGLGLTIAGAVGVMAAFLGGRLSDRVGADRLQLWATVVQGLALFAYVFATDVVAFVAIACVAVGARSLQGTAKATLQARWFTGAERVTVRAKLRVVTNVFIGVGALLAAVALAAGTAAAYRATMVLVAALILLGVAPLSGLRRRVPGLGEVMRPTAHDSDDHPRGRSPLSDRTYLATTVLNAVIAMQFGIQNVGIPLWVAGFTRAPDAMVSVLMVINTAGVALLQVRAARGTHDILVAGRTIRRAGGLLLVACLLFAVAGGVGTIAAICVLVLAELVVTWAEIWAEAGGWGLAFELADPTNVGAYQGVSQTGYSLAAMLAPTVITATAIEHGTLGWLALGLTFALAGSLVAVVAGHAARRRTPAPEPELELA